MFSVTSTELFAKHVDVRIELNNVKILGGKRTGEDDKQNDTGERCDKPDGRFETRGHGDNTGQNQAVGAAGLPKLTLGASRSAAEETSKNSRCLKPSIPAKMLVGNCRIFVLKSRTTAL